MCPAPCENACTLALADSPVTIKSIELAIAERDGQVSAVLLQRLHWKRGVDGHWEKHHGHSSPQHLDAQLVFVAIGFAHTVHDALLADMAVTLDAHGNVAASDKNYQTSLAGVFSCGDMRRGQSLVVWAIHEGRQCARAVDVYLSGDSELPVI